MKITTILAVALASATLAACGGGAEENNLENADANLMMTDNTMLPADDLTVNADNVTVIENGGMNATDMNTMDMNATTNTL